MTPPTSGAITGPASPRPHDVRHDPRDVPGWRTPDSASSRPTGTIMAAARALRHPQRDQFAEPVRRGAGQGGEG